jgi:general secretion pathway protein G
LLQWFLTRINRKADGTDDAGFTLIELLIVIAIIGILAGVVLPQFGGRREQARRSRATADIESLSTALDMYETDMGRYPTAEEGLEVLFTAPSGETDAVNWQGPYLKKKVTNDPWGHPYNYSNPGEHNTTSFDLSSFGQDGQEGGEDAGADVVNWEDAAESSND